MTKKIRNILLALDLRETTYAVIAEGKQLAKQYNVPLMILHAQEDISSYIPHFSVNTVKKLNDKIEQQMDDIKAELIRNNIDVRQSLILKEAPSDAILSAARDHAVDLIVIGASRKNFLERLLGTHAERLIRSAEQPVWVIHPGDRVADIRNVLCAVDCSPASNRTLNSALQFCRSFNANLHILHIFVHHHAVANPETLTNPFPDWSTNASLILEIERELTTEQYEKETKKFRQYLTDFDLSSVTYDHEIRTGEPVDVISNSVAEIKPDLLVLGATDRSGSAGILMRGTIGKILRECTCPIVTVKHAGAGL